ncbi:structural maintenance of chromosomes protein 5-like [Macrobrachium nipponense]|uniref:structural maintenance of chromosomes protein 5-like n=1 Tax=Macrobrachium nipponense TaxID=159736 RepID=UPI0030C7EB31
MAFKSGNIVRVSCQNFLTFDNITVWPKPYLNLILGPNGSGKSSILCAICIGLGGKPEVTGRSKNLESYVKKGKDFATVEVELFAENKPNVVIKREFGNHVRWYLQGKPVSKKEISNAVENMGIQIDNLCSFLPQDRVANFARMNAIHLLEATEKAVGDPKLFEYHDLLRNSGSRMQEVKSKVQQLKNEIDTLEKQNARLKTMVDSVQEKKKLEEQIKKLEKQRIYHRYEKKRQNTISLRTEIALLDKEIKHEKKLLDPLNKQIEECKESSLLQKRALHTKIAKSHEALQKVKDLRTQEDKLSEDIKATVFDFNTKKEAAQQQRMDLENFRRQLDVLERQFESLPAADEEEIRRKLQALTQDVSSGSTKLGDICNEKDELIAENQDTKRQMKNYQARVEAAQDVTQQRFELLRQKNVDAFKAAKWLKDNENKFSSPFYMPICILINLRDPAFADFVESTISQSDLVAFVFEDKDDMNKFKSMMDRLKLRVNIIHSVPTELSSYRPPFPLNVIRKLGFDTYMSDVIDAPPAVLSYLHKTYSIHSIPIARKENIEYDALPDKVSLFFMGKLRVHRSRSRYDNEPITESSTVREGSLLKIIYDQGLIHHCKQEILKCQERHAANEKKIEELKNEERSLSSKLETWRNNKQALMCREQERIQLQKRITMKRDQVKKCENQKFNETEEETKMQAKLLKMFKSRLTCLKEAADFVTDNTLEDYYKTIGHKKSIELYVKNMEDIIDHKGEKLKTLEQDRLLKEEERLTLRNEAKDLLAQLCSALQVKTYDGISRELIGEFSQMTDEETDNQLCDLKARRDCLNTADEQEIRDYNDREATILTLRQKLKSLQDKNFQQHDELEKVRSKWLPSVTELVQNISSSFTSFMQRLGCSGEVDLIHDAEDDYSKYGIAILVKFRGTDKLRILTAQHQSGGERALATALYMLSLQNLTSVPFRCVDEINQGMDPVNERMMLSMLIETAAREESSQYFFVSPKLLQGMKYSSRVNTIIVYNGFVNDPKLQMSVKDLIKLKKKKSKGSSDM